MDRAVAAVWRARRWRQRLIAGAVGLAAAVAGPPAVAAAPPAPVYWVETTQPAVALTFNVVWGTDYVPRLLQVLERDHASATFMVGGAWAQAHPDLVRRLAAAGMEIGSHGWAHAHPSRLSAAALAEDLAKSDAAIAAIVGHAPAVYAPPYGEVNRTIVETAWARHQHLIMWSIDTLDWRPATTPAAMTRKVEQRLEPGSIVLMHPTERTVEALPAILRAAAAKGLKPVTVSALLQLGIPRTDSQQRPRGFALAPQAPMG